MDSLEIQDSSPSTYNKHTVFFSPFGHLAKPLTIRSFTCSFLIAGRPGHFMHQYANAVPSSCVKQPRILAETAMICVYNALGIRFRYFKCAILNAVIAGPHRTMQRHITIWRLDQEFLSLPKIINRRLIRLRKMHNHESSAPPDTTACPSS